MGDVPLRVAVVTRAIAPVHGHGGLERHVHDLVGHLARLGVTVTVITRPPRPEQAALVDGGMATDGAARWIVVPYWTFPFAGRRGTTVIDRSTAYPLFGYRAGRAAARLVRSGEVDLVHAFGASALGYAWQRRRPQPPAAPFVLNPQGLEEFGGTGQPFAGSPLKRWAYLPLQAAVRASARAADCVIATDRSIEPTIRRALGVAADRVRLVPNAVDLDLCDRLAGPTDGVRLRASLELDAEEALLVSVGRIEQNKGFQVLIRALASLDRPRWRWVLVGDGPFRPRLEREIAAAGLAASIRLAGRVDDRTLHAWYEAATLFVHPTLYEGSSLVTLEAMAHRRAVVATRAGGLPDKVVPGVTGWLVEPGQPEPLARALQEALESRARLPAMGESARLLVENQFAWPRVATRLVEVYRELLGRA